MKTAKLVAGILTLVLSVVVLFQSCAAGVVNALDSNSSDTGGTAGLLVATLLIAGGIVMIATRSSGKKGNAIACIIIFILAALLGYSNAAVFKDLTVWATVSLILAAINVISISTAKKKNKTAEQTNTPEE